MLLVIHNLPKSMGFYDVMGLIQDKCGLKEVLLDNLTLEGDYNRITVGVADEGDAALLVRTINGLYIKGSQLYVEDVRQKKLTEQPYRPIVNPHDPQLRPEKNVQYDRRDARMVSQPMVDAQPMISIPPVQMAYSNLPFYMSPVQTSYTNYDNHAAQGAIAPQPQVAYFQTPIQQPVVENKWTSLPEYASYPNKPQRLPDVDPNSNSRDWQLEERRQSRSRSPARFSVPDDEPQWRDRKKTESSRSRSKEQGRRSPRDHRERSGKTSRRKESDGRSERDRRERSPARRRDEGDRSSRRGEDATRSKHPSYIERSPPRDRDFDTRKREDHHKYEDREGIYDRNDKRRAVDYRDRERRRSSDRYEKPRDYDKLYKPRYNKPIVEQESDRDFGNKRPYTDVSQSSRTYGNDPDNCTFSVSNASIFEKQPIARQGGSFRSKEGDTERGSFDPKVPAKRSRLDLNKVASGPPKVDPSKPTSVLEPDMHKMIIGHNKVASGPPKVDPSKPTSVLEPDVHKIIIGHNKVASGPPKVDPSKPTSVLEPDMHKMIIGHNKVASGPPKVDPSKPTSVLEPDMHKMIIRHNNWRYQVAGILGKQIMSAAGGPDAFRTYAHVYKKLKECVVARIDVSLGNTIVRSLVEMIESFRSRSPPEDDVAFFNAFVEKIGCVKQETAADLAEGIDNMNEYEGIDYEEEDTYNADATEHDDLGIVKQEKEVGLIEDDDVTNTQGDVTDAKGDEGTELTEGVDAGSGDQNDCIAGDVKMEIKTVYEAGELECEKMPEARCTKQAPGGGGGGLLPFDEDVKGAGIDNLNENEGIADEEEDTYNADATEHDDVGILKQEKEVGLIEDDDVTNTQGDVMDAEGDEGTELTEGVDAGSGDQNDCVAAGIHNTNENEGIDDEEHDDVVIVEQETEVVLIEDDDVTDAEGDEGTELTEDVDPGSGDQNDCIDHSDNNGNNVESLEKGNEKTAENVESLENEQTNEEYLKNREESLRTGEDTLQKAEETLEKSEDPSEIPETEFSVTGDNLVAEITDEIADEDLEDF